MVVPRPGRRRVVVVGGGIGGLAAAWFAAEEPATDVVVLEATAGVGGALRAAEVAGVRVDVGAEAMLARRPEGVELARAVGRPVVHPATTSSRIWTRGALRPLPRSLMGVPLDLDEVAASGVLSAAGLARARAEDPSVPVPGWPDPAEDVTVGDLVSARLGEEVVQRLVEPLLGGVYAGHAHTLSARATVPQLVALARDGRLVPIGPPPPPGPSAPVFAGLPGGLATLPEALAASGRFAVRAAVTVRALERAGRGWRLLSGSPGRPVIDEADAVVLATPAAATARLLAPVAPSAAAELGTVEAASVAVVTLALRAADMTALLESGGSGFLVPPVDGRRIKAATFSFAKWAWVRAAGREAGDLVLLRTSLGRHREVATLQVDDAELVRRSLDDLRDAVGLTGVPVDAHVARWGGALPQYALGHLDRVARIRADIARHPGLALCGATYDGVGVPAVIGSARRAVDELTLPAPR